jgi:hypothetical protein
LNFTVDSLEVDLFDLNTTYTDLGNYVNYLTNQLSGVVSENSSLSTVKFKDDIVEL